MTPPKQTVARILVATDLSGPADEAIRQAHDWSTRLGAELAVCHVVPTHHRVNALFPQRNATDAIWTVDLERRVSELVEARVMEQTGRPAEGFRLVINAGKPEAGILEAAAAWNVDLIVIGSRGDTGLARILLGNVSERVVRYAPCSVLVARPCPKQGIVLAATDLSDASFPAVKAGAEQARLRAAKLVVLHNVDLWPPPVSSVTAGLAAAGFPTDPRVLEEQRSAALQRLEEILGRLRIEATCRISHGPPDAEIIRAADELEPELLVIGTHGRTGLSRLALGSVAERVVETANSSVLVVRLSASTPEG
jgi:nucleotide-binding universal stress UspA family protein